MNDESPLLVCSFRDEDALYQAFMPFIDNGGLFVRTNQHYPLGTEIALSVRLFNEADIFRVEGRVIWVTPKGAQGNKPAGVGVQFADEDGRLLSAKIETYLAGLLQLSKLTDTL